MQRLAFLSSHAGLRLAQRTRLAPAAFCAQLDAGRCVDLGDEQGSNRRRRLFFSSADRQWFVCVQDWLSGEVVTVWTMAYYRAFGLAPSQDQLDRAKAVSLTCADGGLRPTSIAVKARYQGPEHVKTTTLLKIKVTEFGSDLSKIVVSPQFVAIVSEGLKTKGLDPGLVFEVGLQLKGALPVYKPWPPGSTDS